MTTAYEYSIWKSYIKSWQNTFIINVLEKFDNTDYVLKLGKQLGYTDDELKQGILNLPESRKDLAYKIFDKIWEDAFQKLKTVSEPLDFVVDVEPLICTLSTGRVNAIALPVPVIRRYILAFDVGLFVFISSIADHIVAHLIPAEDENKSVSFTIRESFDQSSIEVVVKMILSYYENGMSLSQSLYFEKTPSQKRLISQLREMIKLFIVGHEYGHVGLNHFENGRKESFNLMDDTEYAIVYPEDWVKELEADQIGLVISSYYYADKGIPFWFTAPIITYFLGCSELIYSGLSIILDKEIKETTHPPLFERIMNLEKILFDIISEQDKAYYYSLKNFCFDLIEETRKRLEKVLLEKKEKGIVLADIWQKFIPC